MSLVKGQYGNSNLGVQNEHPEYRLYKAKWKMVDDVIAANCKEYLRNVGKSEGDSNYAAERQTEYEDSAVLQNFTGRTRDGMQGAIFTKCPDVDLPTQIEYLLEDVDGNGLTLFQQMQDTVDQVLRKGRAGLLADMPSSEEVPTIAQMESGELVPRIQKYEAQNIINWRVKRYGSINKLSMIVLEEEYEEAQDDTGFFFETFSQYRVLGLDDNGDYYQEIWYPQEDNIYQRRILGVNQEGSGYMRIYPKENGRLRQSIPFYFVGSQNNDYTIDAAPLYPIAELNIGHYRNSADTEESAFISSQAMLILALSEQINGKDWAEQNPDGVRVGSRRGLNVGPGGSATFIQADESDKAQRLMDKKEEQAIAIGAQLITPNQTITAESARIQQGANVSTLQNIALNVSAAYEKASKACAAYMGIQNAETKAQLNQEFFMLSMTSQDRAAWASDVAMGTVPITDYWDALRRSGQTKKTDDELRAEIEEQSPVMTIAESEDD